MSISTVKTQLLASLNALGTLKAAYNYETGNPSGSYPFATLTLEEGDGEFASTCHNRRRHAFLMRVYQEQTEQGQGVQNAERIAIEVLDELNAHLDLNTTLSGVCKFAYPTRYRAMYENRELGTRVLEVHIDTIELTSSA